jgi:hypothetical protein
MSYLAKVGGVRRSGLWAEGRFVGPGATCKCLAPRTLGRAAPIRHLYLIRLRILCCAELPLEQNMPIASGPSESPPLPWGRLVHALKFVTPLQPAMER